MSHNDTDIKALLSTLLFSCSHILLTFCKELRILKEMSLTPSLPCTKIKYCKQSKDYSDQRVLENL